MCVLINIFLHNRIKLKNSIHELLELIVNYIPSSNPYTSLLAMVLKKEGNVYVCPYFHALNKITIKDKFPIPIIDDILDELPGVIGQVLH
jgi:hypothetical protein